MYVTALETVATVATVETVEGRSGGAPTRPLVVLGLDSASTASSIEWAAEEAIARGAALEIVLCVQSRTDLHGGHLADAVAATRDRYPLLSIEQTATRLDTPSVLVDMASSADLLIVGESQLGTSTTPSAALRRRSCPVIVLRGRQQQPLRRIAIGIDDSSAGESALEWAADEADHQRAMLTVIHAWQRPGRDDMGNQSLRDIDRARAVANSILDDAVDRCSIRLGRPVHFELVDGSAAAALVAGSMRADLVAVGSRGSTGYKTMLFGSVARFVLDNADCPVAVIHPSVRTPLA